MKSFSLSWLTAYALYGISVNSNYYDSMQIMPQMIIVSWVSEDLANEAELAWIARAGGGLLTNRNGVSKATPRLLLDAPKQITPAPAATPRPSARSVVAAEIDGLSTLESVERDAILATLKVTRGNKLEACRRLKIGRQTLYNKLKRYGIAYRSA